MTANGIQNEPAVPMPGFPDTWANRHAAALVESVDARRKAEADPKDAALELARWEALGGVTAIEQAMATEIVLMLRKANQHSARALRQVLADAIQEVLTGTIDGFRDELAAMAEAIARLDRRRPA
jgi:hypothetical protein